MTKVFCFGGFSKPVNGRPAAIFFGKAISQALNATGGISVIKKKILVVTSSKILYEGLTRLLSEHEIYENIEYFDSLDDLLVALHAYSPSVVIVAEPTFELPIGVVVRKVKESFPVARIVALQRKTSRCSPALLFRHGVAAVLCGRSSVEALNRSVNLAMRGQSYISEQVAECLVAELSVCGALHDSLSTHDLEIFFMLINGYPPRVIARCLSTSRRAISVREAAIKARLNVKNVSEMVKYAIQYDLLHDLPGQSMNFPLCEAPDSSKRNR